MKRTTTTTLYLSAALGVLLIVGLAMSATAQIRRQAGNANKRGTVVALAAEVPKVTAGDPYVLPIEVVCEGREGDLNDDVEVSASGGPPGAPPTLNPTRLTTPKTTTLTIATTNRTPSGSYGVRFTARSLKRPPLCPYPVLDFSLQVDPPVVLKVTPKRKTLRQGGSITFDVEIQKKNYNRSVKLTTGTLPKGVTASFSPNDTEATQSTLTLTAAQDAKIVNGRDVIINGIAKGGVEVQADMIKLDVKDPSSVQLDVAPPVRLIQPGASTSYNLTITRNNFPGDVEFEGVSNLPAGATATPNTQKNPTSVTINTVAGTERRRYDLRFLVSYLLDDQSMIASADATLMVGSGRVILSVSRVPPVPEGDTRSTKIRIERVEDYQGDVSLQVRAGTPAPPRGVRFTAVPPIVPANSGEADLMITVDAGVRPGGPFGLIVDGMARDLNGQPVPVEPGTATFEIIPSGRPVVRLRAVPDTLNLALGEKGKVTIFNDRENFPTGDIDITASASTFYTVNPPQARASFSAEFEITNNNVVATSSVDFSGVAVGNPNVTVVDTTVFINFRPSPQPPPDEAELTVSPTSLSFAGVRGGPNPSPTPLAIGSTGGALNWSASDNVPWLALSPASGTTPSTLNTSVNLAGLTPGTLNGTITVSAPGSPAKSIPVTLVVSPPSPTGNLTVSPPNLSFTGTQGGPNPASKTIAIGSTGSALNWTATDNAPWLSVTPATGSTPASANVSVNLAGLAAGTLNATITVSAAGSPSVTVPVSLVVSPQVALPTITGFTPSSGPAGTLVNINGTNFNGDAQVRFNGVSAGFSAPSSTLIQATVPAGATTGPITVLTATGTATSPSNFVVMTPAPTISSFTPTSGRPGDQVTVNGTNFNGVTSVTFNGANAQFTVNSANQLRANVPSGATTGPIRLTSPGGTATSAGNFTVTQGTLPTITSFSPTSGSAGTLVSIIGTNFDGDAQVRFNGVPAGFSAPSSTLIQATVPAGATTGPITVLTATGTATSPGNFVVSTPAPTISSFSPASGRAGDQVTINGTNFNGVTTVTFNGANAQFFVSSPTQLFATVPLGATTGPVRLTSPGGTATSPGNFVVTQGTLPTITSFSPTSGPVGTLVSIIGTNFDGDAQVRFNGVFAGFSAPSSTLIQATVPPGATTGPITVLTATGLATSPGNFIVTTQEARPGAPAISGFQPSSGPPGTNVVIVGSGLDGATSVTFGGVPASDFSVVSATRIRVIVPSGARTGPVRVVTPGGTAFSPSSFVVQSESF